MVRNFVRLATLARQQKSVVIGRGRLNERDLYLKLIALLVMIHALHFFYFGRDTIGFGPCGVETPPTRLCHFYLLEAVRH